LKKLSVYISNENSGFYPKFWEGMPAPEIAEIRGDSILFVGGCDEREVRKYCTTKYKMVVSSLKVLHCEDVCIICRYPHRFLISVLDNRCRRLFLALKKLQSSNEGAANESGGCCE